MVDVANYYQIQNKNALLGFEALQQPVVFMARTWGTPRLADTDVCSLYILVPCENRWEICPFLQTNLLEVDIWCKRGKS